VTDTQLSRFLETAAREAPESEAALWVSEIEGLGRRRIRRRRSRVSAAALTAVLVAGGFAVGQLDRDAESTGAADRSADEALTPLEDVPEELVRQYMAATGASEEEARAALATHAAARDLMVQAREVAGPDLARSRLVLQPAVGVEVTVTSRAAAAAVSELFEDSVVPHTVQVVDTPSEQQLRELLDRYSRDWSAQYPAIAGYSPDGSTGTIVVHFAGIDAAAAQDVVDVLTRDYDLGRARMEVGTSGKDLEVHP